MRNTWPFALVLLIVAGLFLGSVPQQGLSVEGAWKLVHMTSMRNGARMGEFPASWSGQDMKIWSKGHFTFVGRIRIDTVWNDFYGGGTYVLDGMQYKEMIQFHSVPALIGTTARMSLQIKGDTLIQAWPVGEDGQIDRNNFNEEKYVRLD